MDWSTHKMDYTPSGRMQLRVNGDVFFGKEEVRFS